jgi:hypothetical protein
VRPYFAAPGYWGRIGYWHNPTDIKGADVALAWKLGAFAIDAKGGIYKGSNRPASFVGKDDEITHIAAGVLWNASEKLNLNVSYEGVLWNLKTSGRREADGELRHAGRGLQGERQRAAQAALPGRGLQRQGRSTHGA